MTSKALRPAFAGLAPQNIVLKLRPQKTALLLTIARPSNYLFGDQLEN
jgi:hypothetical protein